MRLEESQFLRRLKVPKARKDRYNDFLGRFLPRLVRFSKEDSMQCTIPAIIVHTKGKGIRETFFDYELVTIDTGKIGKCWGDMAIHLSKDDSISHTYPRKFRIDRDHVLKLLYE